MVNESLRRRARENASGLAATTVTGTWLAMLMLGFPSEIWLAVMLFGYIAVVPFVSTLFDADEERTDDRAEGHSETTSSHGAEDETALERLRRRYAEGELTDEQFERKLERLLETETLEDVERSYGDRSRDDRDSRRQRERELE